MHDAPLAVTTLIKSGALQENKTDHNTNLLDCPMTKELIGTNEIHTKYSFLHHLTSVCLWQRGRAQA